MSTDDENQLKQEITALLVSAKGGLTERQLSADYRSFNGDREIPYKALGFPNLLSMLKAWPEICQIKSQNSQDPVRILAVAQKNTKHILSMVKQQKSKKLGQYASGKAGGKRYNGPRDGPSAGRFADRETRTPIASGPRNDQRHSHFVPAKTNQPHFQPNRPSQARTAPVNDSKNRGMPKNGKQKQPIFANGRKLETNSNSFTITVRATSAADSIVEFYEDEEPDDEDSKTAQVLENIRTLLTEFHHGIRLKFLDEAYTKKFRKSLLKELNLRNIMIIQKYVEDFATISRQDEGNDSCDHIITLKDNNSLDQLSQDTLEEIAQSGIVPSTFTYENDLVSYMKDISFQGIFSDIDANSHYFYIRSNQFEEHLNSLAQELNLYYSHSISDRLVVKDIGKLRAGLSCVVKRADQYCRAFIESSNDRHCRVVFVDYGSVETIERNSTEFKHLLTYFSELPRLAMACRLDGIQFLPKEQPLTREICKKLSDLLTNQLLNIEIIDEHNGRVAVRIFDDKKTSLSDYLLEIKLVEVGATNLRTDDEVFSAQNPNMAQSSTSLVNTASISSNSSSTASSGKPDEKVNSSSPDQSKENHRLKWIELDENRAFYLIRHENDHIFISLYDFARLLRVTESDILSETLIPRARLDRTDEFQKLFDSVQERSSTFLFIFDVIAILDYFKRFDWGHLSDLKKFLEQLVEETKNDEFWRSGQKSVDLHLPPTNQSDFQRYNELLTRRKNILCNMFRTTQLTQSAFELESIENELRLVIEKMRHGARNNQQKPIQNDSRADTPSTGEKDKLKTSMERCKTLINTILSLDNYVVIEDYIIDYIEVAFSTLNAGIDSTNAAQLHEHYEDLLKNLTLIVNDLQQKIPIELHLQ